MFATFLNGGSVTENHWAAFPASAEETITVPVSWFRAIQAIIYWELGIILLLSVEKLHFCDYNLIV